MIYFGFVLKTIKVVIEGTLPDSEKKEE